MSDLTGPLATSKPKHETPNSFCSDCGKLVRVTKHLGRWLCELCLASYDR